jgi:lipopolysaccharide/colanic/teichoic acid biosynthesis glycosyltransferase
MVPFDTSVTTRETGSARAKGLITFGTKLDGFIWGNVRLDDVNVKVVSTAEVLSLELLEDGDIDCIINLNKINNVRYVNKFFAAANQRLPQHGYYIGRVETKNQRKERIYNRFPWPIATPYYLFDFVFHRMLPKMHLSRKFYFWATKGQNRVITLSETLGRLISCGFEIVDFREVEGHTWFIGKKRESPRYDFNPTYGLFVKLTRVGKDGKYIQVRKFRTMHPFSEYIQEYLFNKNNLKEGGKLDRDFRITSWGKVIRKLWIDEIPMIWNLLKGEIKLFGVRPLSRHYFSLYPEDFQQMRIRHKPGLIPPFYVDMPKTLDEIVDSEKRYLEAYERNPLKTDIVYLYKALCNIIIRKARSA